MNKISLITAVAGTLVLAGAPANADHHEKAKGASVSHPVAVSHAKGATLWNYHGKKIGEIEDILLMPGESGAMAIVDTSVLEDDRKIIVPWKVLQVQTKKDDADDIIYALDADNARLQAAPVYSGDPTKMTGDCKACCTYWDKEVSEAVSETAKQIKTELDKGAKKVREAVVD